MAMDRNLLYIEYRARRGMQILRWWGAAVIIVIALWLAELTKGPEFDPSAAGATGGTTMPQYRREQRS